jgi:hypothetical protein
MQIKFSDERIKEYYEGGVHFLNNDDGEPIEVSESLGNELLKAIHFLDDEQVHVFTRVEGGTEPTQEASAGPLPDEYADEAAQLAKKPRAELMKMAKAAGLDGDSYTNRKELAIAIAAATASDEAAEV